jgi:hypothetical protein
MGFATVVLDKGSILHSWVWVDQHEMDKPGYKEFIEICESFRGICDDFNGDLARIDDSLWFEKPPRGPNGRKRGPSFGGSPDTPDTLVRLRQEELVNKGFYFGPKLSKQQKKHNDRVVQAIKTKELYERLLQQQSDIAQQLVAVEKEIRNEAERGRSEELREDISVGAVGAEPGAGTDIQSLL